MGFRLLSAVCLDLKCGTKPNRIAGRKTYIVQTPKRRKEATRKCFEVHMAPYRNNMFHFFQGPDFELERH